MDFYLFLGTLAATLLGSIFYMVYGKIRVQENQIIASSPPSPPSSSSWPLSLPSSSWSRSWEYDVFPSFHGPDVRKQFLSHVLKAFESKGISFFNDNKIQRGESIAPELKSAIKESKIAVVLLSKNYASSSWCLDELVEIMNTVFGQTVLTIFYEVDPTDVKKQTGDFGKVFRKTCRGKTKEKIESWRKALEGVATIAGYHSRNWDDEAVMIENIAADISKMLNHFAPSPCLIGMRTHMERMKPYIRLDLDEVRMIGIWGPPGIGKSTIARYLFDQLSNSFRLKAIMVNIKGNYPRLCLDEGNEQLQLQSKMLSQMINQKDIVITHLGVAQQRLKDKKVLLVLDDVDRVAQLDALAKKVQWFGPGSRIIITTENLKLLKAHGIKDIYKVDFPSDDEALKMFCMYAFDQKFPKDGFTKLSRQITYLAGKLPLGLKVMGSYLREMTKQEWEKVLPNLWRHLNGEIETVLKFSYDALCDEDKYLFLHIACFFDYEHIKTVEGHLANKISDVRQRLDVLAEKSLISFYGDIIKMHSLLVELGKDIVRKQHPEPGQRQFLVDDKDICEVLTDPTAMTRSVIGIDSTNPLTWHNSEANERVFEGMSNLQFLRFRINFKNPNLASLSGCMKYISPKLQLIKWEFSPMTCLPFTGNLEFLVELYMPYSKLEKLWEGIKVLRNLQRIDLRFSRNLKELPDFSTATNLQYLNLNGCSSLVKLPSSIGNATNLQELDLIYCSRLVELPSSIGNATNLQKLDMSHCSSLVELPSSIGNATNLQKLNLSYCSSLVELPSSIGNAVNLQKLDLSHCSSLVELPSSIGYAANLQILDLSYCSSLVELPSTIGNATNLQDLNLRCCCSLVEFPSSIGNLYRLTRFNLEECSKLEVLPTNINLESLYRLILTNCSSLKSFPEISTNIEYLKLNGTAIEEVPSSIRLWSRLKELHMSYSENLKESPHAFDRITELHLNDTRIQELSPWVKGCSRLRRLVLNEMENLVSLPQLPDSLQVLDAENCKSLERLDCTFRYPDIRLNFRNCFKLNEEARDAIIQASSAREFSVLPGGEVPAYFTYRAPGSSVTVELNEKPLRTSTKFKACILFVDKGKEEFYDRLYLRVYCIITSKQNARTRICFITSKQNARTRIRSNWDLYPIMTKHLYIFDLEAENVTSTELVFEFKFQGKTDTVPCKIKECGVLQL